MTLINIWWDETWLWRTLWLYDRYIYIYIYICIYIYIYTYIYMYIFNIFPHVIESVLHNKFKCVCVSQHQAHCAIRARLAAWRWWARVGRPSECIACLLCWHWCVLACLLLHVLPLSGPGGQPHWGWALVEAVLATVCTRATCRICGSTPSCVSRTPRGIFCSESGPPKYVLCAWFRVF